MTNLSIVQVISDLMDFVNFAKYAIVTDMSLLIRHETAGGSGQADTKQQAEVGRQTRNSRQKWAGRHETAGGSGQADMKQQAEVGRQT